MHGGMRYRLAADTRIAVPLSACSRYASPTAVIPDAVWRITVGNMLSDMLKNLPRI